MRLRSSLLKSLRRSSVTLLPPACGAWSNSANIRDRNRLSASHYHKRDFDALKPCRYFICSPSFSAHFSITTEVAIFDLLKKHCSWKRSGPLAECEVELVDEVGDRDIFFLEAFNNRYETLCLFRHSHEVHGAIVVLHLLLLASLQKVLHRNRFGWNRRNLG